MHVHTNPTSSDSMLTPRDLLWGAANIGLTGVNITDHDQVLDSHLREALFMQSLPELFLNFGMEVSTDMGHMLAIGLKTYLPGIRRAQKLREELDRIGGFLIAAHPFRQRTGEPFTMTPEQAAEMMPIFKVVHSIEVANGANTPEENYFAAEVARLLGWSGTGGSDAHSESGIGVFATGFARPVNSTDTLLEELHAGRFEPVHRTKAGRWVRFEPGSIEAARES